jgi:putative photosynthetic complex assembly protein
MGSPADDHHDDITVPRGLLLAAGALIAVSLLAVAIARYAGISFSSRSQAPVVAERMLRFEDRPDGSIAVIDASAPAGADPVLRLIDRGSNGFFRGALRALARERRLANVGPQAPFRLVARKDGRLTLEDTATPERVDLESFGPANSAAFAQLLTGARPASAP